MPSSFRKVAVHLGGILVAAGLLVLALRNVDFSLMWQALVRANYWWLVPLIVVSLLSHLLRAWRWQVQLEALPEVKNRETKTVSLGTTYLSILIGYMVNSALPRMGEVVRSANVARREKLALSAVLGTVVVERVLDVMVLVVALFITVLLLLERPEILDTYVITPIAEVFSRLSLPGLLLLALGLAVVVAGAVMLLLKLRRRYREGVSSGVLRIVRMLRSFRDGLLTLFRSPRRAVLIGTTVLMWIGYWATVHLPFYMLDLAGPYQLGWDDSWIVLALGTVGFALFPSPGGTGSYHYVTIATLVLILSLNQTDAATYAVVSHAALTLMNVLVGLICLVIQGSSLRALRIDDSAETKTEP